MLAELKREVGRLVVQTTAAVTGKILTAGRSAAAGRGDRQAAGAREPSERCDDERNAADAARQLFRLCLVDGALDDDRVAAGRDGRRRRPAGAARSRSCRHFQRLVRLDRDRHTAPSSRAPTPLPDDLRDDVAGRPGADRTAPGLETVVRGEPGADRRHAHHRSAATSTTAASGRRLAALDAGL